MAQAALELGDTFWEQVMWQLLEGLWGLGVTDTGEALGLLGGVLAWSVTRQKC